jgi:putative transposase
MPVVVDELSRECLAIRVGRRLNSEEVLEALAELFVRHGPPEHVRSDDGPEFVAKAVRAWLRRLGGEALFTEPGSPWENGCCESFNGEPRDELLDREILHSLQEAQVLLGPRRSLGRAPAPQHRPAASRPGPPAARAGGRAVARTGMDPPTTGPWPSRPSRVSPTLRLDRLGGAGQARPPTR